MKTYLKIFVSVVFVSCYCCTISCNRVMMTVAGIKQPKPKTDKEVMAYIKEKQLDYDYIIRPGTDSEFKAIFRYMKMGFNGLVIYDDNGNEVQNTNDTTCHMKLRDQITDMLSHAPYSPGLIVKNNRTLIDSSCRCLDCGNGQPLYKQPLKPYVLFFGIATYIPIKKELTDLDFVSELKEKGLRDKVTVVLLDADIH